MFRATIRREIKNTKWHVVGFSYPHWITMHGQPHINIYMLCHWVDNCYNLQHSQCSCCYNLQHSRMAPVVTICNTAGWLLLLQFAAQPDGSYCYNLQHSQMAPVVTICSTAGWLLLLQFAAQPDGSYCYNLQHSQMAPIKPLLSLKVLCLLSPVLLINSSIRINRKYWLNNTDNK